MTEKISLMNLKMPKKQLSSWKQLPSIKTNCDKDKIHDRSRQNYRTDSLKVNDHTFEQVRNFKCFSADTNKDANSLEEVKTAHYSKRVLLWTETIVQV